MILIQTLKLKKDAKGNKLKLHDNNLDIAQLCNILYLKMFNIEFKTEYIAILPLYD